jgi:hypothetical protein
MLRTENFKWYFLAVGLAAILVLGAGSAAAQSFPDTFGVTYYSFAHETGAPDGKFRVDNPGTDNGKDLCADIYVFDESEELLECCGCKLTPDGLRTLSVNKDLTGNTANGEQAFVGVIKLLSAAPNTVSGGCDPTGGASFHGFPNNIVPTPNLRAWETHLFLNNAERCVVTDQEVQSATLSTWELNTLQRACFGILQLGSGRGKCTCGAGD